MHICRLNLLSLSVSLIDKRHAIFHDIFHEILNLDKKAPLWLKVSVIKIKDSPSAFMAFGRIKQTRSKYILYAILSSKVQEILYKRVVEK